MKRILAIAAVASILAACGGQAKAQALANSNVVVGPGATMDISTARYTDVTPGAQTITDARGVVRAVQLVNPSAITGSEAYKSYAAIGGYKAINLKMTISVSCSGSSTVIDWVVGNPEVIADGCALQSQVQAVSRR